jgi:hypothetical protein
VSEAKPVSYRDLEQQAIDLAYSEHIRDLYKVLRADAPRGETSAWERFSAGVVYARQLRENAIHRLRGGE